MAWLTTERVFAYGEYTHTLRLTSELVELRAGYANLRIRKAYARSNPEST